MREHIESDLSHMQYNSQIAGTQNYGVQLTTVHKVV